MNVLLGVCGGVAAYKAAELVRLLQQQGATVEVAMTASAQRFITPLTFASLTGKRVHTSLWTPDGTGNEATDFAIEHIQAAQRADVLLIAPATANMIARLAHGLADDFVSTAYLATDRPVVVAPAMNVVMWRHPVTQANVAALQARGVRVISPDAGYLACGMTGDGRLAPLPHIVDEVLGCVSPRKDLAAESIVVTAGGTREAIDAVRYLGNRSSGRMGHAIAEAAAARGAQVDLITTAALPAEGCRLLRVESALQMQEAVMSRLDSATMLIKAAAVADFRPRAVTPGKLRRQGTLTLELESTPDIVAEAARRRKPGTLVIAFAAETENMEAHAKEKLRHKQVDAVVANNVSLPGLGFDANRNAGIFVTDDEVVRLPESSKREMAERILDEVVQLRARALAHSR